jgi:hypothetical protein
MLANTSPKCASAAAPHGRATAAWSERLLPALQLAHQFVLALLKASTNFAHVHLGLTRGQEQFAFFFLDIVVRIYSPSTFTRASYRGSDASDAPISLKNHSIAASSSSEGSTPALRPRDRRSLPRSWRARPTFRISPSRPSLVADLSVAFREQIVVLEQGLHVVVIFLQKIDCTLLVFLGRRRDRGDDLVDEGIEVSMYWMSLSKPPPGFI